MSKVLIVVDPIRNNDTKRQSRLYGFCIVSLGSFASLIQAPTIISHCNYHLFMSVMHFAAFIASDPDRPFQLIDSDFAFHPYQDTYWYTNPIV